MRDQAGSEDQRRSGDDRRRPYEAPELRVIATVSEATLGTQELLSDGVGLGGSIGGQ